MIIVKCNGCGKQMWDALSQQEIEALVHEAINASCIIILHLAMIRYVDVDIRTIDTMTLHQSVANTASVKGSSHDVLCFRQGLLDYCTTYN